MFGGVIKVPIGGAIRVPIHTSHAQQVLFVDVFLPAKVRSPHSSTIKHMLETSFDQFRSSLCQSAPFG